MNEKTFLSRYHEKLPIFKELSDLRKAIVIKKSRLTFFIQQLKILSDKYIVVFLNIFQDPNFMNEEQYKFHFLNFYLMHVFVADEFVFLKCGRMLRLNTKETVNPKYHSARKGWFNKDYKPDGVDLSECSFEGYVYRFSLFLDPMTKDAGLVPKVIYFVLNFIYLVVTACPHRCQRLSILKIQKQKK